MSIHQIALVTSASFIGMFFGATLDGMLSDRFGRKCSLIGFVAVSSLASLATALVNAPDALFAARVITGFGISAGMVTIMTYISELYPAQSRGTWLSWAMVINLSAIPLTTFSDVKYPAKYDIGGYYDASSYETSANIRLTRVRRCLAVPSFTTEALPIGANTMPDCSIAVCSIADRRTRLASSVPTTRTVRTNGRIGQGSGSSR